MKAKDFDKKFEDDQEDIIDDLDLSSARRVNLEQKRINVDFPPSIVAEEWLPRALNLTTLKTHS